MIERHPTAPGALHPLRAIDLTASEVGTAWGKNPYKTALTLYGEKTGLLQPQGDNPAMRRGRWLESAARTAIRETYPGWVVRKCNFYIRDPDIRLGATPDAVALTDDDNIINLQLKSVAKQTFASWRGEPPLAYRLQALTEAMLMDVMGAKLMCLVTDSYTAELYTFNVPRNPEAEAKIRQLAIDFWENVRLDRRPLVDPERDAETIAALYPRPEPEKAVDFTGDNLLAMQLHERGYCQTIMAKAKKRISAIDTDIRAKMGDAELATLPGWKLRLPLIQRAGYQVGPSEFRQLSITKTEEQQEQAA